MEISDNVKSFIDSKTSSPTLVEKDDTIGDAISVNLVGIVVEKVRMSHMKCLYIDIDEKDQPLEFRYYEMILELLKMKVPVGKRIRIFIGMFYDIPKSISVVLRTWLTSLKKTVLVCAWSPGNIVVVMAEKPLVPAYKILVNYKILSEDKTNWYHLPMRVKSTAVIPFINDKSTFFNRGDDDPDESPLRRRVKLIDDGDG